MSKLTTKKLCTIAMLTALATVFNAFSIQTSLFSVSFIYLTAFFTSAFMGPIAGFLVGVIADMIGFVIAVFNGGGGFLPTLTLSSGIMGVIPWIVFRTFKRFKLIYKIIFAFLGIFLVCTMGINTLTLYFCFASKQLFLSYFSTRLLAQTPTVVLNCIIVCLTYKPIKKVFEQFDLCDTKIDCSEEIIENDTTN